MAIHTIWISIQLHTTGLCWMKNTRIPGSSKGKTSIPSRPRCREFDKTQQRFLLLSNDMLTLWVFSPLFLSSQITLVDNIRGRSEHKYRASSSSITLKLINNSAELLEFLFCWCFLLSKNKATLSLRFHRRQGNSTFPFLQLFLEQDGSDDSQPRGGTNLVQHPLRARVLSELYSERTSTLTHTTADCSTTASSILDCTRSTCKPLRGAIYTPVQALAAKSCPLLVRFSPTPHGYTHPAPDWDLWAQSSNRRCCVGAGLSICSVCTKVLKQKTRKALERA